MDLKDIPNVPNGSIKCAPWPTRIQFIYWAMFFDFSIKFLILFFPFDA